MRRCGEALALVVAASLTACTGEPPVDTTRQIHVAFTAMLPLSAIAGSGPDDVWAVGSSEVAHWDGSHWSETVSPTRSGFSGVWAFAPNDVWAVGSGTNGAGVSDAAAISHFDGTNWSTSWTDVSDGTLVAVWGAAPNDVWAVGSTVNFTNTNDTALIVHWDGTSWSRIDHSPLVLEALINVFGNGPNDMYFGTGPRMGHWDGNHVVEVTNPAGTSPIGLTRDILDVKRTGPNEFWFAGYGLSRWDGHATTATDVADETYLQDALWPNSPQDVFVAGYIAHDRRVNNINYPATLVYHWDGNHWMQIRQDDQERLGRYTAIWSSGPNDVWLLNDRRIEHIP